MIPDIRNRRSEAGFTLLEFLVALSVLGLVAVLATGLLRSAAEGERRLAGHASGLTDRITLERLLRREMSGVLPLLDYEQQRPQSSFSGTVRGVRFVGRDRNGKPEPRLIRIDAKGRVSLSSGRFSDDMVSFSASGAGFAYFGRKRGTDAASWHPHWERELALPRLLRLSFDDGQPVIVALRVERSDW